MWSRQQWPQRGSPQKHSSCEEPKLKAHVVSERSQPVTGVRSNARSYTARKQVKQKDSGIVWLEMRDFAQLSQAQLKRVNKAVNLV